MGCYCSTAGSLHTAALLCLHCAASTARCALPLPHALPIHLQVVANSRALAAALMARGYKVITGGTDNHLFLWDLRPEGISGSKMEKACDLAHITLNKNAVVGDVSAMNPGGVRIGEGKGAQGT